MIACENGDDNIVERLLSGNGDVNAADKVSVVWSYGGEDDDGIE